MFNEDIATFYKRKILRAKRDLRKADGFIESAEWLAEKGLKSLV